MKFQHKKIPSRALASSLVFGLLVSVAACSSGYMPKANGKVALLMKNGEVGYSRDGRFHKHGFLGGGLIKAVRGVPAAEKAARTHRSRLGWGGAAALGGALCSSIALVFAVGDPDDPSQDVSDTALITSLACLGGSFIGLGYMISAMPYQYDAINIFNDSVVPVDPVHMPGQAPPLVPRQPEMGQQAPGQY